MMWYDVSLFACADGIYMYEGSDSPEASDGLPSFNIIADNYIEDALEGLKMGDTVGNEFSGNVRQTINKNKKMPVFRFFLLVFFFVNQYLKDAFFLICCVFLWFIFAFCSFAWFKMGGGAMLGTIFALTWDKKQFFFQVFFYQNILLFSVCWDLAVWLVRMSVVKCQYY